MQSRLRTEVHLALPAVIVGCSVREQSSIPRYLLYFQKSVVYWHSETESVFIFVFINLCYPFHGCESSHVHFLRSHIVEFSFMLLLLSLFCFKSWACLFKFNFSKLNGTYCFLSYFPHSMGRGSSNHTIITTN